MSRALLAAAFALLPLPALAAGYAEEGDVIAHQWCAECHVVDDAQTSADAAAPSFQAIAKKYGEDGMGALAAFLADPHPVMPDMSLTRQEIRDLTAYISSLRAKSGG
ncbi:c-type cytochrome [Afifella sp. IM 167]|uniref:c-type cytochrome n=1 Tax=Afifella sp. IM 167 TaxID=2033586 RepID=UPI001CCE2780|nr:c-type cytochrome [Afifella sp. IM 167]MBZ8131664.1 cytochrome C [Afifella sp. IM 167]